MLRETGTTSKVLVLGLAVALLAACDPFPKDEVGTTEAVTDGTLRAGLIADEPMEPDERSLVLAISEAAGADADIEVGSAEALLPRLERGELDLVVGRFAGNSPWKSRVALTAAADAASPPSDEPVLRGLVRAGENRWLIFVSGVIGTGV